LKNKKNAYKILLASLKEREHLGIAGHRWEDYIKMDLKLLWCVWSGFKWLSREYSCGFL